MRLCPETIYRELLLRDDTSLHKKYCLKLRTGRGIRKSRWLTRTGHGHTVANKTMIDQRPASAVTKLEAGHWECDLVRHEALQYRAEVRDLRRRVVASSMAKLGAARSGRRRQSTGERRVMVQCRALSITNTRTALNAWAASGRRSTNRATVPTKSCSTAPTGGIGEAQADGGSGSGDAGDGRGDFRCTGQIGHAGSYQLEVRVGQNPGARRTRSTEPSGRADKSVRTGAINGRQGSARSVRRLAGR
jgi:hypothetical protein